MTGLSHRLAAGAVIAVAAFGPLAASMSATAHSDRTSGPRDGKGTRCEIVVAESRGMLVLEPVLHTTRSVDGVYRLRLTGRGAAGSTDISQGSDFVASAGGATSLGRISLSPGATYDARLDVEAGGESLSCRETIRR